MSAAVTATQNMTSGLNKLLTASLHYLTIKFMIQCDYTLKRMSKLTSFQWLLKQEIYILKKDAFC
jgi:hypothetical protein